MPRQKPKPVTDVTPTVRAYSPDQLARAAGLDEAEVCQMVTLGMLPPPVRIGDRIGFLGSHLELLLKGPPEAGTYLRALNTERASRPMSYVRLVSG